MTKYHIPVIGWLIATVQWQRAYGRYNRDPTEQSRQALWVVYDRTHQGFWPTLMFLLLCLVIVKLIALY